MRHFSNQVLTDANQKPKLEILSQDKFRAPAGHLTWWSAAFQLAQTWFTLTWPTLRFFYWLVHMCTGNSRGCKLTCVMSQTYAWIYKSLQKVIQPIRPVFSSLTNDYCRHEECWSKHSNVVAMLWCLDDTHLPYEEAWNLFLVTICQIWSCTQDWVREYFICVQKVWKTVFGQVCQK